MIDYLAARRDVIARPGLTSPGRRHALSEVTDGWIRDLYASANAPNVAIAAVGGFGRQELSPGSDLDVVIVYPKGLPNIADIADRIWYPMWDVGVRIDHSVRTIAEARHAASNDVKVATGLLDIRHIAGPADLIDELRSAAYADWRGMATRRLPELREAVDARIESIGEAAHVIEPDLKEAYGGIRDVSILRAIAATWLTDVDHSVIDDAGQQILDIRDALHVMSGRNSDKLVLQEQDAVAAALNLSDADDLLRRCSEITRRIAHASDMAWHDVERTLRSKRTPTRRLRRRGPTRVPLADGVVAQDGEVVLAADVQPARDPVLPMRAAAAAAQASLSLAPHALIRLSRECPPLPEPWPVGARDALVSLLGAGRACIPVWESLDHAGFITRWIPEWAQVRCAPQRNPIHRFTVDRHLVECAANAAEYTRTVSRPDLLLVGALLHDIGKARGGDHTEVGIGVCDTVARQMGFDDDDVDVLVNLVRHHLLLPTIATTRDIDDPETIGHVADCVSSIDFLELLYALTLADAAATGPAAWSDWKHRLIDRLVANTAAVLAGDRVAHKPALTDEQRALAVGDGLVITMTPIGSTFEIVVASWDRLGLLGTLAGVFARHRLHVRSAQTETIDDRAITVWTVQPFFGDPPALDQLREDVAIRLAGGVTVDERLTWTPANDGAPPDVRFVANASSKASVLEVRAHDSPGLLHRVAIAISMADATITAARVSTLGADVVDVFYLVCADGNPLSEDHAAAVRVTVLAALS